MMSITLTSDQLTHAFGIAQARWDENRRLGMTDRAFNGSGRQNNRLGCAAEYAAALALGVPWTGDFQAGADYHRWRERHGPDIGAAIQVRSNRHGRGPWVYQHDPDDQPFVYVVTADSPTFDVVGWIMGRAAKREEWRSGRVDPRHGRRNFLVPPASLEPTETLMEHA